MNKAQAFYESPLYGNWSVYPDYNRPQPGYRKVVGNSGVKDLPYGAVKRYFDDVRADRDYQPAIGVLVKDVAPYCDMSAFICIRGRPVSGPPKFGKKFADVRSEFVTSGGLARVYERELRRSGMEPSDEDIEAARDEFILSQLSGGSSDVVIHNPSTKIPLRVHLKVACSKCVGCKTHRQQQWFARTKVEWEHMLATHSVPVSNRDGQSCGVWHFTGTCSPEQHLASRMTARAKLADQGIDFEELSLTAQFNARLKHYYNPRITKVLDLLRVRKRSAFRYLIMCELHEGEKSGGDGRNFGEPHWHVLLFETDPTLPLRERLLRRAWANTDGLGSITEAKLARSYAGEEVQAGIRRVINYVTKYITKSAVARIRASQFFGSPEKWAMDRCIADKHVVERISEASEVFPKKKETPVSSTPLHLKKNSTKSGNNGAERSPPSGGCDGTDRPEVRSVSLDVTGVAGSEPDVGGSGLEKGLSNSNPNTATGVAFGRFSARDKHLAEPSSSSPVLGDASGDFTGTCDQCMSHGRLVGFRGVTLCEECFLVDDGAGSMSRYPPSGSFRHRGRGPPR